VVSVTDAASHTTSHAYNPFGKLIDAKLGAENPRLPPLSRRGRWAADPPQ
jgi:hypothetical protein